MANKLKKAKEATALLSADHAKVRKLLAQLEKAQKASRRTQLLQAIAKEIAVHTKIEEEIFYPAFRRAATKKDDLKMYFEAGAEHGVVKMVLPDLERTPPGSEEFAGKAKVLKDLIEHHAEEEEKEMFPRARKLLSGEMRGALGAEMAERKNALMAR